MHRELGTKERDCSGPSRVVFEELWMNESLWWETLGHPLVLCTGLSPLLGNSPTSGCKMKLLAWTKCRTYSQEKRKGQAPAAEEDGRVKAWAVCFLAKGEVFGTVRKTARKERSREKEKWSWIQPVGLSSLQILWTHLNLEMPLTPHFCAEHPEPDVCTVKVSETRAVA